MPPLSQPRVSALPNFGLGTGLWPLFELCDPALFPAVTRSALILLLALTLAMFSDVLFTSDRVLSSQSTDLASQFVAWREFSVAELKAGHLPLWNPHIFSGAPFLGGFQAALLYPPNIVYLIFPLAMAINWGIALHVYLFGVLMYFWARERRLSPLSAFVTGAIAMFSGTYFPHIFAGHLPNLCHDGLGTAAVFGDRPDFRPHWRRQYEARGVGSDRETSRWKSKAEVKGSNIEDDFRARHERRTGNHRQPVVWHSAGGPCVRDDDFGGASAVCLFHRRGRWHFIHRLTLADG